MLQGVGPRYQAIPWPNAPNQQGVMVVYTGHLWPISRLLLSLCRARGQKYGGTWPVSVSLLACTTERADKLQCFLDLPAIDRDTGDAGSHTATQHIALFDTYGRGEASQCCAPCDRILARLARVRIRVLCSGTCLLGRVSGLASQYTICKTSNCLWGFFTLRAYMRDHSSWKPHVRLMRALDQIKFSMIRPDYALRLTRCCRKVFTYLCMRPHSEPTHTILL